VTSPHDSRYNCIAWAAGNAQRWWWPAPISPYYWPEELPKVVSLTNFLAAFVSIGFAACDDGEFRAGHEKVALYCKDTLPTHAARQLPDGSWASKLGRDIDIVHSTVECLHGEMYGVVAAFMERPIMP